MKACRVCETCITERDVLVAHPQCNPSESVAETGCAHSGFGVFPKRAVVSMVGVCGFAGSLGGMPIATITGWILQGTGSLFVPAGFSYLIALGPIHLIAKPERIVDLEG